MDAKYNRVAGNASAVEFFKCLGDETRLDIVNMLMVQDCYVELIASRLLLTPATVSFHLKKMEKSGLVTCSRSQFYMIYSINRELLHRTVESFFDSGRGENRSADEIYRDKIIKTFIINGKLTRIPAQLKKREIILSHIAGMFELGREYCETDVNQKLLQIYDDYCTLRRDMIGSGLLERSHETYRRIK